ncbi:hypothetical protein ASE35_17155 [Lysobacter sp. Root916]|uniref:hypothetical protein n=1 Tax=Lysobacter sp. Root916 TaxID=1736606 RepID=UPI000708A221|nr:hypothetical protein [Lysobacter sp. Root916]KRD30448.1 hypothetical protein ASE35_17155 [Lysobacter sp. Root916]
MALDLIQARHDRDAPYSHRGFALDESLHAQLLAAAQPRADYPLLHKMHDYYADTTFLLGELRGLHAELARVAARCADPAQVRALQAFVEVALADGDNLYACAD